MRNNIIVFISLILSIISCTTKDNQNKQTSQNKTRQSPKKIQVDTMHLQRSTFTKELVSNGNLQANKKAKLKFSSGGQLTEIPVNNGQFVRKGTVIACLNEQKFQTAVIKAKSRLEQAKLELRDILIGQGYDPNDTASVPDNFMETAKTKSRYESAKASLREARSDLKDAKLHAPFSGTVANITHKPYEHVSPGKPFCLLIDNKQFEVSFSVLETELKDIQLRQKVTIKPLATHNHTGSITEINPVVIITD